MNIHESVTHERVMAAVREATFGLGSTGFCVRCGDERDGCEPDAEKYRCHRCRHMTVYGAEQILFMLPEPDPTPEPNRPVRGGTVDFLLKAVALNTVLPFVSTDKNRPVLQHVACLTNGRLVTTNGHVLGAYNDGHTADTPVLLGPTAELKRLAKKAAKEAQKEGSEEWDNFVLKVSVDDEAGSAQVAYTDRRGNLTQITVPVPDDVYPNFEKVFPWGQDPKELSGFRLNGEYLSRFGELTRLTFYGSERAAVVRTPDPRFIGLIMPLHEVNSSIDSNDRLPFWIREGRKQETAAA